MPVFGWRCSSRLGTMAPHAWDLPGAAYTAAPRTGAFPPRWPAALSGCLWLLVIRQGLSGLSFARGTDGPTVFPGEGRRSFGPQMPRYAPGWLEDEPWWTPWSAVPVTIDGGAVHWSESLGSFESTCTSVWPPSPPESSFGAEGSWVTPRRDRPGAASAPTQATLVHPLPDVWETYHKAAADSSRVPAFSGHAGNHTAPGRGWGPCPGICAPTGSDTLLFLREGVWARAVGLRAVALPC